MTLGIGIIGLGRIVRYGHLPAYKQAGFKVVAAADIDPAAVKAARQEWDLELMTTSFEEVINSPRVDVVDIATPPQFHRDLTERGLKAGKHVLCQKPFTLNMEDAETLVSLAERLNLKLAVNQQSRWTAINECARVCIEKGYIGEPHLIIMEYHTRFPYEPWRASLPHMIFLDSTIHQFDLLRFWFGMPTTVFAQETRSKGQADEASTVAIASLKFQRGVIASVATDWINPLNESSSYLRVDGSKGSIIASGTTMKVYSDTLPFPGKYEPVLTGQWQPGVGYIPAFAACMRAFLDAVEGDTEPPTSGRDNLQTLKLTFGVCRSAETGKAIDLRAIEL